MKFKQGELVYFVTAPPINDVEVNDFAIVNHYVSDYQVPINVVKVFVPKSKINCIIAEFRIKSVENQ